MKAAKLVQQEYSYGSENAGFDNFLCIDNYEGMNINKKGERG